MVNGLQPKWNQTLHESGIIAVVALLHDKFINIVARVLDHPALRVDQRLDSAELAVVGHAHSIRGCVDDGGVALVAVAVRVDGGALALLGMCF